MTDFTARPSTIKAALLTERKAKCPYGRFATPAQREQWEAHHREVMAVLNAKLLTVRA